MNTLSLGEWHGMKKQRDIHLQKIGVGLTLLSQINQWEKAHMPWMHSSASRDLYFSMAEHYASRRLASQAVKTYSCLANERLMRNKIRFFKHNGWIRVVQLRDDKRSKVLLARPMLVRMFLQHAAALRRICAHADVFVQ